MRHHAHHLLLSSVASFVALVSLHCGSSPGPAPIPTPTPEPNCQTLDRAEAAPGDFVREILFGGRCRSYRLHVPPSYEASRATPMILGFHGYTGTARDQELGSGMSHKADEAGFLAVYPQGSGNPTSWNVEPFAILADDVGFCRELIAHLSARLSVDRRRVYATGFSRGGGMANRVGCDLADVVAAIAPLGGAYPYYDQCAPSRPMPVISIHGAADSTVPFEGSAQAGWPPIVLWARSWAARNGCNLEPLVAAPGERVTSWSWSDCNRGADVQLLAVAGWGHTWPRGQVMPPAPLDGMDVVWPFFEAHPLPE